MNCPFCDSDEVVKYQFNQDMFHVTCKKCDAEWVE